MRLMCVTCLILAFEGCTLINNYICVKTTNKSVHCWFHLFLLNSKHLFTCLLDNSIKVKENGRRVRKVSIVKYCYHAEVNL